MEDYVNNTPLPIEKFVIDRELSNDINLPYLRKYIMGEHIGDNQVNLQYSTNLEYIICYAEIPPILHNLSNNQFMTVVVGVPDEFIEKYRNADGWSQFWNLYGLSDMPVKEVLAEVLTINPNKVSEPVGMSIQLSASILPENVSSKEVAWNSSDDSIATVDETGLVTIVSEGSCTIYARTTDGSDLTAECLVAGISGIEEIFEESSAVDVYDINGKLILKDTSVYDFRKLQRGLYIVNGKKVFKTTD